MPENLALGADQFGGSGSREEWFAAKTWNAKTLMTLFRLSVDQVAELGGQVEF